MYPRKRGCDEKDYDLPEKVSPVKYFRLKDLSGVVHKIVNMGGKLRNPKPSKASDELPRHRKDVSALEAAQREGRRCPNFSYSAF